MFEILSGLFDPTGFPQRWQCGEWSDTLGWLHIISDLAIFAAYYAVPIVVTSFVLQRKDIPYRGLLLLFIGMVFFSCGTVHLVEAAIFWWPVYRLSGVLKLFTAIVSCGMVGVLIVATPKALGLRNLAMMAADLQDENARRQRVESDLRAAHARLELILDSTADAIISVNGEGKMESFNAAAERLLGHAAGDTLGKNLSSYLPNLGRELEPHLRDKGLGMGVGIEPNEGEVVERRLDGTEIQLAYRATEADFAGSRQFIVTLRDITERTRVDLERERLFRAIRDAAAELSTASSEISSVIVEQVDEAHEQAAAVTQTMTSVREVAGIAHQTAEIAKEVAVSSQQADEVSQSGRRAVDDTIAAMQTVRKHVASTVENISSLADRAQAIGKIIATVNEIADQTNVLALNAAIEASRAGEQGKGFAVVAAEVRSLAEQSKAATDQVRKILGEIQQATHSAVLSTEQGTRSVNEASAVVLHAKETINSLAEAMGTAAQSATRIVASASQQAAGMEQIQASVTNTDARTRQHLQSTQQVGRSSSNLRDLGDRLRKLIETGSSPS